jgi:hypothetical protein
VTVELDRGAGPGRRLARFLACGEQRNLGVLSVTGDIQQFSDYLVLLRWSPEIDDPLETTDIAQKEDSIRGARRSLKERNTTAARLPSSAARPSGTLASATPRVSSQGERSDSVARPTTPNLPQIRSHRWSPSHAPPAPSTLTGSIAAYLSPKKLRKRDCATAVPQIMAIGEYLECDGVQYNAMQRDDAKAVLPTTASCSLFDPHVVLFRRCSQGTRRMRAVARLLGYS